MAHQRLIRHASSSQASVLLECDDGRTSPSPHQTISGSSFVTEFVEFSLDSLHRRIRCRKRRCRRRRRARGRTTSKPAPAFSLKLAPVRFNVSPSAFQCPSPIAEAPAAAVVVGHHRVEAIHIGIDVVVERRLRAIHADVLGQAIPDLRCRKDSVLPNRRLRFSRTRRLLRLRWRRIARRSALHRW